MSHYSNHEQSITNSAEMLEIINEEQLSPAASSIEMKPTHNKKIKSSSAVPSCVDNCSKHNDQVEETENMEKLENLMKEKENELKAQFAMELEREIELLKDKFDFILQNEQIRTSYMLCEAHRERKEKIDALQTQLECKNLAGLMYVLCAERRRSKIEKLQMAEDYTEYIEVLQQILTEAQTLILRLASGYKTAAKVEDEWRTKLKNVMKEFQAFVCHFVGGKSEFNQYFFNLPLLLQNQKDEKNSNEHSSSSKLSQASESDATIITPEQETGDGVQNWWDMLDKESRPFVMFGDMADFPPPKRRAVLKSVKTTETVPKKWKDYVFNEQFLKAECPNISTIKEEYLKRCPEPGKWECTAVQTQEREFDMSRRMTPASIDMRGNMGSILKIIASNGYGRPVTKATLLGARDSMEIASTTKLREKRKHSDHSKVTLNIGSKRVSRFDDYDVEVPTCNIEESISIPGQQQPTNTEEEDITDESLMALGSLHNDSLQVIPIHVPDQDATINYEKVCPMEKCQRMHMDSFLRTLPPYMKINPFTHFETTYEEYEPCSPEQLEILQERIEHKKKINKNDVEVTEENLLTEWKESSEGIAVQTSNEFILPPCTCYETSTPEETGGKAYNIENLIPIKLALDEINKKYFYDNRIDFNRFKVIGEESDENLEKTAKKKMKTDMLQKIRDVLYKHPELCDIFRTNA